jgi:hypothetical protein
VESYESGAFGDMFSRISASRQNGLSRDEHLLIWFLRRKS